MSRALGRYELVRPLARGGMAEVFLARRRAAGIEKLLVVKRIRPERSGDARFLELFMREARLSMSLTHGNIVPVFDFGRSGDQVFLAMEWVEGRDLASSLARASDRRLSPLCAAFVAAECCQALTYAHARRGNDGAPLGIVHRDVTPRNVLVSWSGEVKLTDFGIAALAGDSVGQVVGTPGYLAPEQARGETTDARADVYALGLVLREALTGEPARAGADRETLLVAARSGALTSWPPALAVDDELRAIVDRATAAASADRFPDAAAFAAALDDYLVAARAAVRGPAPSQQLAAWMATAWDGARDGDTRGAIDGGDELLSFLDDGAMGTGTARSLVATADDSAQAPAHAEATPPSPALAPPATRRRAPLVLAVLGVAAVAAIAVAAWPRRAPVGTAVDASAPPRAPDAAVGADAAIGADAAVTDGPALDAPALDAAIVAPSPLDAGRIAPRPRAIDAAPPPIDAAAPTVRRKVRINARPWALVTVDGTPPARETIATFELPPGRHRVHLSNPQLAVERDVTIDVPADRDLDFVVDLRP